MVAVRVNGSDSPLRTEGLTTVADLIELIKSSTDPDHMITSILVDGKDLSDQQWTAPLGQLGTSIVEFETDSPQRFVSDRLLQSADVVRACFIEFRDARKQFQAGKMVPANQTLGKGVATLKAFFEWISTMIELVPQEQRARYDVAPLAREITEICKKICQQQLYQSWWALGETLEKELEPKLDALEDFCRKFEALN